MKDIYAVDLDVDLSRLALVPGISDGISLRQPKNTSRHFRSGLGAGVTHGSCSPRFALGPLLFVPCSVYLQAMRVLGIDLGTKNIGTAVSDALGLTVRPVETIRRSSDRRDIARLKFLVNDLEAEAVVVGLPLRMDGTVGDAATAALRFVQKLAAQLDIAVFTQDERLTSFEAEQMMIERGFNRSERRARSDEFAAMIILQDYLSASSAKG